MPACLLAPHLLVLSALVPASPAPQEVAAPGGDTAAIEALVLERLRQPGAVAVSVAVARGDEMLYERAHGFAELEHAVPANEETMFRIGSITKQFTAAAIQVLAERGKLHVDDPLTEYLPDYPTHGHEITLRHLLTHTSGVPSYTDLGPPWELHKARELPDEELVALWKDLPLDFEPGTRWRYSNSGYYLLGMVIERVSGQDYAEFLRDTFFDPLKLSRTRYDSNSDVILNRAQGYGFRDGAFVNDAPIGMSQPGAAGALVSTAGDLVRWQQALVGGRAVKPASYEEMTLPFLLASGGETTYGFGLGLEAELGQPCVSHGGGIDGFNSYLAYFPEARLHVAAISNGEAFSAQALALALARKLLDAK